MKQNVLIKDQQDKLESFNGRIVQSDNDKKALEARLQDIQKQVVAFAKVKNTLETQLEDTRNQLKMLTDAGNMLQAQLQNTLTETKKLEQVKADVATQPESTPPVLQETPKKTKRSWFGQKSSK
jgi:chromosome segregation ATPase